MHCFICPTYGQYEYARAAVESFFQNTHGGVTVVVDDGHPKFHQFWDSHWNVVAHHFNERSGLTRSWNHGLTMAREIRAEYTICGNSDILFTPGWHIGPVALLADDSVGLVGPLTNGPGLTNELQNIWDHVPDYVPSDEPVCLAEAAQWLRKRYQPASCFAASRVNGFFMIGRTTRWWQGRYDNTHVFNPDRRYALTENENELQDRFRSRGWHSLVSLRSYIFHYRAVTRGEQHKHGMWLRRSPAQVAE